MVRIIRSTLSKNAFSVNRASRTVSVENVLQYIHRATKSQYLSSNSSEVKANTRKHLRHKNVILDEQLSLHCVGLQLSIDLDDLFRDGGMLGSSEGDSDGSSGGRIR